MAVIGYHRGVEQCRLAVGGGQGIHNHEGIVDAEKRFVNQQDVGLGIVIISHHAGCLTAPQLKLKIWFVVAATGQNL